MTARPLLLILNPRRMQECLDSFAALTVPRAYMTGYTERELCTVIPQIIAGTDYTHFVAISDDTVVSQRAVDAVYERLEDGHGVVTGWCNLDGASPLCSVVDRPLVGEVPSRASYSFMHWSRVVMGDPLQRTWFAGMCLTGMSREMWARYPFDVFPMGDLGGFASDYRLCWRLQEDGVPIMAVRDAGVLHVREQWDIPDRDPRKKLYLGGRAGVEIIT